MSRASAVTTPPPVSSRSASRRGSYLEQLLSEHPTKCPESPAAGPPPVVVDEPPAQRGSTPAAAVLAADTGITASVSASTAGALTWARTHTDDETEAPADAVTTETADGIAASSHTALPPLSREITDWTAFGTVIPILAGHPGGGASVLAAVLADALAARGHEVLLVDAADPLRSGLADATTGDGPRRDGSHRAVGIRQSGRGPIRCARLEFTDTPLRSAGMVPAPQYWTTPDATVDVTVVDIGWDAWALAPQPLLGLGGWLRHGSPTPRPVVALRPTLPAARHTEQLLARLSAWTRGRGASEIAAVAVMGTTKLPPAMRAVAGDALTPLLEHAVCLPTDRALAERGITADPTPTQVQHAVVPLLTRWDLLGTPSPPTGRGNARKSLLRRKPPTPKEATP